MIKRLIPHALIIVAVVAGVLVWQYFEKPKAPRNRTGGPDPGEYVEVEPDPSTNPHYVDGKASLDAKWEPPVYSEGTWSQWRGPRQDGINREKGLLTQWPKAGLPVVWTAPMGEGFASVVVNDGKLYAFDQQKKEEGVRCFDAETGKPIWVKQYGVFFQEGNGNGPRATPAVYDGKVYVQGGSGIVHCLDAKSGEVIWKKDLVKEFDGRGPGWGFSASPMVHEGRAYFVPGGDKGNGVAAFHASTGELIWKAFDDSAGCATPVLLTIGERLVVAVFNADGLIGADAKTGEQLFRVKWSTAFNANIATPIVHGRHIFISTGYDVGCALIELVASGPKVEPKVVYRNNQMRNHFATSVVHEGFVYGFDEGFLSCMNFATGKRVWKARGFDKGNLTMADGKLIILGERGKLALARPNPEKYEEISSFAAMENKCWTVPVVANGRLYIRNEKILKCFDLRAK